MNRCIQLCFSLLAVSLVLTAGCARPVTSNPRVNASNVASLVKAFGSGAAESGTSPMTVAAEPTGWSTLKGTFKLAGGAPTPPTLSITKDPAVCAPGGKPVFAEDLVVDKSTDGIRDIVIYLVTKYPAGDPKWEHEDYLATAKSQNEMPFDQKECIFLSHLYVMRSSQTVLIKNSDPVGHNTNITASAGSRIQTLNELMPANTQTIYKPAGQSAIPNPVACSIHPWMSAYILTRDNPYYAVTQPNGTFEIKNVPAGVELEFAVWQQKAGFLGTAKVSEGGAAAKDETWKKGRFKRTLTADTPLDLNVTLDIGAFNK